jgi:N-acetylglucosamine kinase-like BadF-type ATPase
MTRYVLGIDAGGSKTLAAIIDEYGTLYGMGRSGSGNFDDVGVATAHDHLRDAVAEARGAAGLPNAPFAAAFLGVAGVVSPADRDIVHEIASALSLAPAAQTDVDHDCRIALAAGLTGRSGIVLIAGTGSSCFGMNAVGAAWLAGGWGHLIADEGSGYWLGVEALKAAVRSYDGRSPHTMLQHQLQQRLGLASMNDVMHRLYVAGLSRSELAALAPLVIAAANCGDAVAQALIARGTEELADAVLAVAHHLGMADAPHELARAGGLFRAGDAVVAPLRRAVAARLRTCHVVFSELPPVLGACLLALQLLKIPIAKDITHALQQSALQTQEIA